MKVFVIGIAGFLGSHIAEALLDPAAESGFRPIPVGPAHPGAELFWPVPGRALGFGTASSSPCATYSPASPRVARPPDFVDGLRASEVVAAAWASAVTRSWQGVERLDLAEGRDP